MKLSQLMAGAVLTVSLLLTGCAATSLLSAATSAISPNKPDITAQVGAENTKQGIGVTSHVTSDTKVGDVKGHAKVDTSRQGEDSSTVKDISGDAKVDASKSGDNSTEFKSVTGGTVDASKQGQAITAGPVQAKVVNVNQGDTHSLLWAFGLGLGAVLLLAFGGLLLVLEFRKGKSSDGTTTESTSESTTTS